MNERIKELSDIAYKNHLKNTPESSFGRRTDYDKEFAELIIRECAKEAFEFWCYQVDCNEESAQSHIEKHFGVEE